LCDRAAGQQHLSGRPRFVRLLTTSREIHAENGEREEEPHGLSVGRSLVSHMYPKVNGHTLVDTIDSDENSINEDETNQRTIKKT
jgi:hypothetical protein